MSDADLEEGMLINWKEFLESEMDLSYDWLIPDLLERGERVIVVAAEGAGKTTLMRQVALMSSAGTMFSSTLTCLFACFSGNSGKAATKPAIVNVIETVKCIILSHATGINRKFK